MVYDLMDLRRYEGEFHRQYQVAENVYMPKVYKKSDTCGEINSMMG